MNPSQIFAILQLLIAFNVPQQTVNNVQVILTNANRPAYQVSVPQTIPLPVITIVPQQPTPAPQPAQDQQEAPATGGPSGDLSEVPAPAPEQAAPPVPVPAITVQQTSPAVPHAIASILLNAGPHDIRVDSITVTVSADAAKTSNIRVTVNGVPWSNQMGYQYESTISRFPTLRWIGPSDPRTFQSASVGIPANGSVRVDVTADTASSGATAQITGATGTDLQTGAAVSL